MRTTVGQLKQLIREAAGSHRDGMRARQLPNGKWVIVGSDPNYHGASFDTEEEAWSHFDAVYGPNAVREPEAPEGMEVCEDCQGVGSYNGEFCETCDGMGYVDVDVSELAEAPAKKRKSRAKYSGVRNPGEHKWPFPQWVKAFKRGVNAAGYAMPYDGTLGLPELPIFDVVDSDMATLAIEKMQHEMWKRGAKPGDAVKLVLDRDKFAVKYYDPYVKEYKRELGVEDSELEDEEY